jgi:plastocyanin
VSFQCPRHAPGVFFFKKAAYTGGMTKIIWILAAIIIVLVAIWKFAPPAPTGPQVAISDELGGSAPATSTPVMATSTLSATSTPLATSTPAMATSTKAFTITGKNYSFDPKTITVKKGDLVKITLKNSGGTHDLKIDEFKVATAKLTNGQSATVEFTADKKGTFEYYCSVGNHRAMGMVGKLIVE